MDNPNCLVTRILKARYFKHMDILNAPLGNKPSYIWRSILWSREIINEGTYWKVGNDKQINARRDLWIPTLSAGKITSIYLTIVMSKLAPFWTPITDGTLTNLKTDFSRTKLMLLDVSQLQVRTIWTKDTGNSKTRAPTQLNQGTGAPFTSMFLRRSRKGKLASPTKNFSGIKSVTWK